MVHKDRVPSAFSIFPSITQTWFRFLNAWYFTTDFFTPNRLLLIQKIKEMWPFHYKLSRIRETEPISFDLNLPHVYWLSKKITY